MVGKGNVAENYGPNLVAQISVRVLHERVPVESEIITLRGFEMGKTKR